MATEFCIILITLLFPQRLMRVDVFLRVCNRSAARLLRLRLLRLYRFLWHLTTTSNTSCSSCSSLQAPGPDQPPESSLSRVQTSSSSSLLGIISQVNKPIFRPLSLSLCLAPLQIQVVQSNISLCDNRPKTSRLQEHEVLGPLDVTSPLHRVATAP